VPPLVVGELALVLLPQRLHLVSLLGSLLLGFRIFVGLDKTNHNAPVRLTCLLLGILGTVLFDRCTVHCSKACEQKAFGLFGHPAACCFLAARTLLMDSKQIPCKPAPESAWDNKTSTRVQTSIITWCTGDAAASELLTLQMQS